VGALKKYVITGPSCAGKSTLIQEFEARGFYVIKELAKSYILEQKNKGINEPWLNHDFQPALLKQQIEHESRIPKNAGIVFLDRGVSDILAFFQHRKQEVPKGLARKINAYKYEKVFFLEPLNFFDREGFRAENDRDEAKAIADLIKKAYESQGYEIIMVPAIGVNERVEFILKHI
jgi:predicted ATPase